MGLAASVFSNEGLPARMACQIESSDIIYLVHCKISPASMRPDCLVIDVNGGSVVDGIEMQNYSVSLPCPLAGHGEFSEVQHLSIVGIVRRDACMSNKQSVFKHRCKAASITGSSPMMHLIISEDDSTSDALLTSRSWSRIANLRPPGLQQAADEEECHSLVQSSPTHAEVAIQKQISNEHSDTA